MKTQEFVLALCFLVKSHILGGIFPLWIDQCMDPDPSSRPATVVTQSLILSKSVEKNRELQNKDTF